jgi:predicted transcriptional regulator
MVARTYRLKVVRDGQEFEAEGDKRFVLDMLKLYAPQAGATDSPSVSKVEKGQSRKAPATPGRGRTLSLREFIQQIGLKKHTDITVAFGYYLEKYLDVKEFTPADINNCYYEAKLETSNTSQMIIHNIKTGRMMPSKKKDEKGKNRYTLTATGESFIESKLNPGA